MTALFALLLQELRISDELELRVRARAWQPWVSGGAKGDEDNSEIEFDEDLDVDRPGWTPSLALGIYERGPAGRGVSLGLDQFSTSGEEVLEAPEDFEGSVFPAGTTLKSRLRFLSFGVDGTVAGRQVEAEPIAWSFTVGIHYLEAELRLSGAGARESEEYGDGNLKFGFAGEYRPCSFAYVAGKIAVYTDVFSLFLGVDSGHYGFDGELSGGLRLGPARLEGGFRLLAWTLNWWESEIDLVAYGPFAGLVLRF